MRRVREVIIVLLFLCTMSVFGIELSIGEWENSFETFRYPANVELTEAELVEVFNSTELHETYMALQDIERIALQMNILQELSSFSNFQYNSFRGISKSKLPAKSESSFFLKVPILLTFSGKVKKVEVVEATTFIDYPVLSSLIISEYIEHRSKKQKKYNRLKSTGPPPMNNQGVKSC
jgi:hypothetical protein